MVMIMKTFFFIARLIWVGGLGIILAIGFIKQIIFDIETNFELVSSHYGVETFIELLIFYFFGWLIIELWGIYIGYINKN